MLSFDSYVEGASGPDGFPFLFYQQSWELLKPELLVMFRDWEKGELNLCRLNFSLLTLIPKEFDYVMIDKFRPITLTNCSFKILSKCFTNRFGEVCNELISPNQTASMKDKFILANIVAAHEIIHDVASTDHPGFIFKLDYEEAYDRISRGF